MNAIATPADPAQAMPAVSAAPTRRRASYLWLLPALLALAAMAYLTVNVLIPTAEDPDSTLYSSTLGYPARQRSAGEPIDVEITKVTDQSFADFVAAAGETVALVDVDIRPQLTGVVKEVLVQEGQRVKQGDTLLTLDRAPLDDKLSRAKADLAIAALDVTYLPGIHAAKRAELEETLKKGHTQLAIVDSRLKRYTSLKNESAASAEEIADIEELRATRAWEVASAEQQLKKHELDSVKKLEEARHTLTIREATVREAERDLEYSVLRAPCGGLVTRVGSQPGELLLLEIAAITLADDIVFKAYIDQTRVNSVQPGDPAIVRLVAHPGQQFKGTVVRVNPSIDTRGTIAERGRVDTRFTYSAWVKLEGEDLPPGLQGHIEFRKDATHSSIPESAVIHLSGGEGMVMVVEDGRAIVNRVELGASRGALREVKSGLDASDLVVLRPQALEPNDLVRPVMPPSERDSERLLSQRQAR